MHKNSVFGGMKSMTDTMSKILNLGVPLEDVIKESTWDPAKIIKRPQLGTLDVGAEADVAVLRLEKGKFRLLDSAQAWYPGDRMLRNEMTIRAGQVLWDRDGYASQSWETFPYRRETESR
jgi:dihydroorotase